MAPKLISRDTVKAMKPGSVIVDVAIDQGGCAETSRATTHSHPTYVVDDVVHYCVANMPGAVARTSTFALSNVTTSFVLAFADKGWRTALKEDAHLRAGSMCMMAASLIARWQTRSASLTSRPRKLWPHNIETAVSAGARAGALPERRCRLQNPAIFRAFLFSADVRPHAAVAQATRLTIGV